MKHRPTRRPARSRVGAALGLSLALLVPVSAFAVPQLARRTTDFIDTLGVNGVDSALIGELGIRHVRSGKTFGENDVRTANIAAFDTFGVRASIEANIFYSNPGEEHFGKALKYVADGVKSYPAGALDFLLGANEPDLFGFNWLGNTWGWGAKVWQDDFYPFVKGDPAIRHIPITSYNYANTGIQAEYAPVNSFDLVDLHHYQGHSRPGTGLQIQIDQVNAMVGPNNPRKPIVITESGYSETWGGDWPVTQLAQAKYDVRLFAETFQAGIRRTYKYNLTDHGQTYGWTWWNSATNSIVRKKAFYAVRDLIDILHDNHNTSFNPGWLDFNFDQARVDIRHIVLQRSNGDFQLLIYNNVNSTTGGSHNTLASDLNPAPVSVTLQLVTPVGSTAQVSTMNSNGNYVTSNATVSGPAGNQSITLNVPDSVMIVRLSPNGGLAATQSGPAFNVVRGAINVNGSATGSFSADGNSFTWTNAARTAGDGEAIPAVHGGVGAVGTAINTSGVSNPAPASVYQTYRWGIMTFNANQLVSGQPYRVRLHFAETHWNNPGQRLFDVYLNGWKVLDNFDVLASAGGKNRAIVREFTAFANSDGRIIVQTLPRGADQPMVCGIEVLGQTVTPGSGWYQLVPRHATNRAIDIVDFSTSNGANAIIYARHNGANQQFRLEATSGGFCRLTPRHATTKALDVGGISTANGANVLQWDYTGGLNQQWSFTGVGANAYRLSPRHATGKCLEVAGNNPSDGANVAQWDYLGGANQRWELVPMP
jgi:hypothetical protein